MTKFLAALSAGRAVTNGWFTPGEVVDFPEWRGRRTVTLRDLLNSCRGLLTGGRS